MAAVQFFPTDSHLGSTEHCKTVESAPALYTCDASIWEGWDAANAEGDESPASLLSDLGGSKQVFPETDPLSSWFTSFQAQSGTFGTEKINVIAEAGYTELVLGAADGNLCAPPSEKPSSVVLSLESGTGSSPIDACKDFVEGYTKSSESTSQTFLAATNPALQPFTGTVLSNVRSNCMAENSSTPSRQSLQFSQVGPDNIPRCINNPPEYYLGPWEQNSSPLDVWTSYGSGVSTSTSACRELIVPPRNMQPATSCITKELMEQVMPLEQQQAIMYRTAQISFLDQCGALISAPNITDIVWPRHLAELGPIQFRNQPQLEREDVMSSIYAEDGSPPPAFSGQIPERKASGCERIGKRPRLDLIQDDDAPLPKQQCNVSQESSSLEKAEEKPMSLALTTTASSYSSDTGGVGPALNTNGRPRARRGSATDPQSVYARHRRERINERLKILQNLVPNGAKVDIVTMLEEAINYVKFLQLQVKAFFQNWPEIPSSTNIPKLRLPVQLLSSDEYWIYAPTTYNGIDVSFDMHIGLQSAV